MWLVLTSTLIIHLRLIQISHLLLNVRHSSVYLIYLNGLSSNKPSFLILTIEKRLQGLLQATLSLLDYSYTTYINILQNVDALYPKLCLFFKMSLMIVNFGINDGADHLLKRLESFWAQSYTCNPACEQHLSFLLNPFLRSKSYFRIGLKTFLKLLKAIWKNILQFWIERLLPIHILDITHKKITIKLRQIIDDLRSAKINFIFWLNRIQTITNSPVFHVWLYAQSQKLYFLLFHLQSD